MFPLNLRQTGRLYPGDDFLLQIYRFLRYPDYTDYINKPIIIRKTGNYVFHHMGQYWPTDNA